MAQPAVAGQPAATLVTYRILVTFVVNQQKTWMKKRFEIFKRNDHSLEMTKVPSETEAVREPHNRMAALRLTTAKMNDLEDIYKNWNTFFLFATVYCLLIILKYYVICLFAIKRQIKIL